jgi:UDP-glucose 4-epimerase
VSARSTVLVTGGAGFIGSNLVDRLLAEDHRVVVIDDLSTGRLANLDEARRVAPGSLEFQRMDVTSESLEPLVRRHQPDVIVHLAAQINVRASVEDPLHDARVNVLGTLNVLEAARRNGVRKVIFVTSGGCIYGEPTEDELPVPETHPGARPLAVRGVQALRRGVPADLPVAVRVGLDLAGPVQRVRAAPGPRG